MRGTIQNDLDRRLKDKRFAEEYGENIARAEIAVTVSQVRRSHNLTQEDLAKRLGTSQSYIAKLESGDANPTIGNIGRILANLELRLVAGVSSLSSRLEEKGVWYYSADVNNVTLTWADAFAAVGVTDEPITDVMSNLRRSGTFGAYAGYVPLIRGDIENSAIESRDFNVIWKAPSKSEGADSIKITGAK